MGIKKELLVKSLKELLTITATNLFSLSQSKKQKKNKPDISKEGEEIRMSINLLCFEGTSENLLCFLKSPKIHFLH